MMSGLLAAGELCDWAVALDMFGQTMGTALELGHMRRYEESANQKVGRRARTGTGWRARREARNPRARAHPSRLRLPPALPSARQALVLFATAELPAAEQLLGQAAASAESRKDAQM